MSEVKSEVCMQWNEKYFFRASNADFRKIPGSPIAYWANAQFRRIFNKTLLSAHFQTRLGLSTANNDLFLRNWHEVGTSAIFLNCQNRKQSIESKLTWFPYQKGGSFRKWFGNHEFLVNWKNDGEKIRNFGITEGKIRSHNYNLEFIFKEGITWSDITSGTNAFRFMPDGFLFDGRGSSGFVRERRQTNEILGLLNSIVSTYAISLINPTIAINVGEIAKLPFPDLDSEANRLIDSNVHNLVNTHRKDWDSYENSWSFTTLPLLQPDFRQATLKTTYRNLCIHWRAKTQETQRLEIENNRIFIEAYGLQDELTPEVPLKEITLTCNPHYRYGGDKTEEELEALLLADTMREFISYAVGCMFGRYSLDKPGLILANQGETLTDYLAHVPEPTYMPDKDNVIPMLDGDWFADDITERFRRFLRVTFGEEHYEENLRFIEEALNVKGKRSYSLRDYFLNEFYTDHLKRYKKRPIYWLFSSPKGSFNALIYMHRYRPDTVSVVLNDYLREFRAKLLARKNHLEALGISASTSPAEKTKALKEIEKISKIIAEVDAYERDTLYPLATQQLEIDLDDGVKANYPKFGAALKKIPGLEAKDD
jgi:hypothetical protein